MNEPITQQGCSARAEANLDGWSQSQKLSYSEPKVPDPQR